MTVKSAVSDELLCVVNLALIKEDNEMRITHTTKVGRTSLLVSKGRW